jgi:hypothetical protein
MKITYWWLIHSLKWKERCFFSKLFQMTRKIEKPFCTMIFH